MVRRVRGMALRALSHRPEPAPTGAGLAAPRRGAGESFVYDSTEKPQDFPLTDLSPVP